ncbi:MAG TPA: response regulator, partial [Spirochaetota bacterium]|nr:response regulator [Spirochaetota bacterium]
SSKRKYGGTGLGLVISKKLIEMMNGNIWFESEENVGTKFYFTTILEKSDKDDFFDNENSLQNNNYEKNETRILVAEDNIVNQEFLSILLMKKGYRVDCVSNGHEVISKIETEKYDIILMDIEMPEMDGIETTIKIREIEKNKNLKNIPIIALTAYAMKGDRDKCINVGMNDYVSKPIRVDLLFSKIEKYLQ